MKRILAALVAVAGFAAVPNTAQAGIHFHVGYTDHYVSGRAHCGCAIYTKRVCRRFDRYHRPVFAYYRQPFHCGCHKKHRGRAYHPVHGYYSGHPHAARRGGYVRGYPSYGHVRPRHYQERRPPRCR